MEHKQIPTPSVPETVEFPEYEPNSELINQKQHADELFRAGDKAAALAEYRTILEDIPPCELRARVLHNAAISVEDDEERERLLRESIDLDPRYKKARLRLARMFAAQGNWVASEIEYTHVEEIGQLNEAERKEKAAADEKAMKGTVDVLKGWGNKILNKFGLSTDDFQTVKNPDGTMSIEMQKKE